MSRESLINDVVKVSLEKIMNDEPLIKELLKDEVGKAFQKEIGQAVGLAMLGIRTEIQEQISNLIEENKKDIGRRMAMKFSEFLTDQYY